jgi:hypothetical protein
MDLTGATALNGLNERLPPRPRSRAPRVTRLSPNCQAPSDLHDEISAARDGIRGLRIGVRAVSAGNAVTAQIRKKFYPACLPGAYCPYTVDDGHTQLCIC